MSLIESTVGNSPLQSAQIEHDYGAEEDTREAIESEEDEASQGREPKRGSLVEWLVNNVDNINIARDLDEQTLNDIGTAVVREYTIDENSRHEWLDNAEKAMKFAIQKTTPKQYPWPGASSFLYPLITQASLQFNAQTYPAIIQGRNVVKGTVWGSDRGTPVTLNGEPDGPPKLMPPQQPGQPPQPVWLVAPGEKRRRADRIGEHMSFQLLNEMKEWEPQTDQLLMQLPIIGGAIRKTYRDHAEGRNYSLFVSLVNLVWDYNAASFESAPRHSEKIMLYPHQIMEMERTGVEEEGGEGAFLHYDYGGGGGDQSDMKRADGEVETHDSSDPDAPHFFIEQHRRWDLDGDGYPEPYIITVHKRSCKVVRIVARYDEETIHAEDDDDTIIRIEPVEHYTLYSFLPSMDGGSYPMGFGHLLRSLNEGINSTLNQLFDAGHLANAGGGFIGDSLGMPSGQVNFQVGRYTRVTTKGQAIRDAVFPLPFPGPNATLFQMLGTLLEAGKEVASIQSILTGDAAIANAPPTTVLALIEQGLKVYTAIHKRIFRALQSELQKIYRLNRLYLKEPQHYRIGDEEREIHPDDYRLGGGVEPIADPTMVTDMQKLVRSQIVAGFLGNPLVRQDEIIRRVLESSNVDRIDDLMSPPDPSMAMNAQMMMAKAQAELGKMRAAELKDQTQAYLNLALARAKANDPETAFIEHQLTLMRLHIESINAATKAAAVDHKFHDTSMRALNDHANRAHERDLAEFQAEQAPDTVGE